MHENSRRRLSKRTVQIDRPAVVALHQPLLLDLADRVQKLLRSADRERRNDHAAAPVKGALQNSGKLSNGISRLLMQPVSVGSLDHQIIRLIHRQRRTDQRQARIADIAAEDKLPCFSVLRQPQLHAGCAEQMTDVCKPDIHALCCFDAFSIPAWTQQPQCTCRVLGRIDRVYRRATGAHRLSVQPLRIGHLNRSRVHQHDPAEIFRCLCRIDLATESVLIQLGQHARVIDMRVCQKNCIDLSRQNRKRHVFKNVDSLLHAIVDQEVSPTALQKRTAPRHFMRCANECKFHGYAPSLLFRSDVFYNISLRLLCCHRAICCGSQNPP